MVDKHTDPYAFRWLGGRLSVDFTATLGQRGLGDAEFDRLRSPDDLSRWCTEAGLCEAPAPAATPRVLTHAHELREALHTAFTAPTAAGLDTISTWSSRSLPGPRLTLTERGRPALVRPEIHTIADLLPLIARDGVDLLTGPYARRIRECASSDCTLLFVDESRPGRRRWCSMDTCGARSKMAGYRARRTQRA
ncbi:ABATE domain-containing protein [Streptomyces sp. VRA16 Mangrove soil]|uniref:CGNR zinc finger domain-containing protein n=1 Tax=Streptomyces sp. VRA16 Mangrove soil TaxID=2817434 RepID=UPI001A9E6039|nr:ABATE domain-containing protein [Streptomyces sp. VRA16 Mangrove soil]MBO1337889.1 ABATE domain-containing protein [Streptomyces sp. VRA16 Mangrove soil]